MKCKGYSVGMVGVAVAALAGLHGCGGSDSVPANVLPDFVKGSVSVKTYDGASDDLLTGGLGKTGLMGTAPAYADPLNPTTAELRRNAIYNNYRALTDFTAAGGFGSLFGPNIDVSGNDTLGEGKVAGAEYIAVADDGSGKLNVSMMVQVPDSFDRNKPCIVTGTSSGSRGVYGAVGVSGEWALKRGCAVAYTDKGTGNGMHDLASDRVNSIDGTLLPAGDAGARAIFRADISAADLIAFNTSHPNRFAYKHAHSGQNPEKDWGRNTLDAIRFAFYAINDRFGEPIGTAGLKRRDFVPSNTLVIASSLSNGGGAAIAAAELDTEGLIDGVAVSEPNVQPRDTGALAIRQGGRTINAVGRPLMDYFSFANVYQPCAILATDAGAATSTAFWPDAFDTLAANRCTALRSKGLLNADTLLEQASEALRKLHQHGWQEEHDFLQLSHYRFATNSIAVTYVNAYGRFGVQDKICGFTLAGTDATGGVAAVTEAAKMGIFATGNGVPPTSGINIVYEDSVGGPRLDLLGVSPSSGLADFSLDGALCIRALATGVDPVSGATLSGSMKAASDRVRAGVEQTLHSGSLRGKPAVVVAGRNDTLIVPNHAGRAYFGKNRMVEGAGSKLSYIEVTHAQHFDTFISFGVLLGYDTRFIPLHYYFGQALDSLYAHLQSGALLPASQVVRTTPRAAGETLTADKLPAIMLDPAVTDRIGFASGVVNIPD